MASDQEFDGFQTRKAAIDLNKLLAILLRRWYIVATTTVVSFSIAFLQLRYTTPKYNAEITLKLDDEKPNQISDLFKYGRTTGKFDNFLKTESEILKSQQFAAKALQAMKVDFNYYSEGKILTTQVYPNPYFHVALVHSDSAQDPVSFNIRYESPISFSVLNNQSKKKGQIYSIFDTINVDGTKLVISPADGAATFEKKFGIINCEQVNMHREAAAFASSLSVEVVKGTSLITLDFVHEVPELASDYLNTFAKTYISQTIRDKSQAAQQTLDFIENQLAELSAKVQKNEGELSNIKSQNNGIEIDELADNEIQKLSSLESERNILTINQEFVNKLQKSLLDTKDGPINFVVYDKEDAANIPVLLEEFNKLMMERITILQKNTPMSPVALENEARIKVARNVLLKTIRGVSDKMRVKINYLSRQIDETRKVLNSLPGRQRNYVNIQRDFKVNEKVYSYLFEKKLETSINKSSITPSVSVIEPSEPPATPISPDRNRYYALALLLGLASGFGIIAVSRLFYQKIPDKETIERISKVKVLGVLKKITGASSEYEIHSFKNPRSIFAESMRSIRSGINFINKGREKTIICITSTVSGEGKTFCTINLAASLTLLNKKVIIIGGDLRRPKVHLSFTNITNSHGLSTILIGRSTVEEAIQHTDYEYLDVITAGPPPPNPSELLQMQDMRDLLEKLKETYDYILIDSAPVGLVSDSMILMEMADINLYVIRAQYSKRDFAMIPERLQHDNNIKNLYILLNAYDSSAVAYGSIYRQDNSTYYSGGGYYYYGGYYGSGGYGYIGKKHRSTYYSGYTHEEEEEESGLSPITIIKKLFKKKT